MRGTSYTSFSAFGARDTFVFRTSASDYAHFHSAFGNLSTAASQSTISPCQTDVCVRIRIPVRYEKQTKMFNQTPFKNDIFWSCRATSKIGVPGTPGTVDLIHALRRLTPKTSGAYSTAAAADSHGWRTPDSVMSTGSRSALSSMNSFQCNPERLKVKSPLMQFLLI